MIKQTSVKAIAILIFTFMVFDSYAQLYCYGENVHAPQLIKTNLLTLPFKTFQLQYERSIKPKTSLGLSFSFTPNRSLPFQDLYIDRITDDNSRKTVEEAQFNRFSIQPEIRFYFGNSSTFTKFYIAPYLKYARYTSSFRLNYDYVDNNIDNTVSTVEVPIKGPINTLSAGYGIGLQYNIFKDFYLDWQIIGNHYGYAFGKISGTSSQPLSQDIQDDISKTLQRLDDIPVYKLDYHVDDRVVEVKPNGPIIGFTMGLSIGYRFR
ncbi:DUF3575 domain-containing protein [Sphingobacterium pedocola]|uniref:DUF3575 domain-containing protein n=1 Tax=Sphingobacterium pedocola TaxID=2082722 RepID=A0ABR9T4F7_9SPHI|nr:DUF3575 domain-containing protein [Sphingobacterium pedocola]MBE8720227.1 hypothetical protein [Sphingobacterium pedocola]